MSAEALVRIGTAYVDLDDVSAIMPNGDGRVVVMFHDRERLCINDVAEDDMKHLEQAVMKLDLGRVS